MRIRFAGMTFATVLLWLGSPAAKATITVEFCFPATETAFINGTNVTLPTTEITGLILGLSASGTSGASGVILTSEQAGGPNLSYSNTIANSFTITDGVVSEADYIVYLLPFLGEFYLTLDSSNFQHVITPTGSEVDYFTSTSAPTFITLEQVAEPPPAGLVVLGLFVLTKLRGRRAAAVLV